MVDDKGGRGADEQKIREEIYLVQKHTDMSADREEVRKDSNVYAAHRD